MSVTSPTFTDGAEDDAGPEPPGLDVPPDPPLPQPAATATTANAAATASHLPLNKRFTSPSLGCPWFDERAMLLPARVFRTQVHAPPDVASSATASANTSVCRSTSAAVVAGDMSAMLWNGVISTPRLSA